MAEAVEHKVVALIPARSGSQRVPDKNVRTLGDHPILAYSIASARASGVFAEVIVSTDSNKYAEVALHYGASVPFLRPAEISTATSPDIEWVLHALEHLGSEGRRFDAFAILRPTSPFRKAHTIQRAWTTFLRATGADSLRAIEKVEQHPGKMWVVRGERMLPLLPLTPPDKPWHSQQKAALPDVYVQNASLEIAWSEMAMRTKSIAGTTIVPFFTEGDEGLDINSEFDLFYIQYLMANGKAELPPLSETPFGRK